jgi:hypothetical protein
MRHFIEGVLVPIILIVVLVIFGWALMAHDEERKRKRK